MTCCLTLVFNNHCFTKVNEGILREFRRIKTKIRFLILYLHKSNSIEIG
jgi:hypothetical protein